MLLYLIRHGKTDSFLENIRQSPQTPLGEYGKKQAQAVAEKIGSHKIDHLYSSDWPRAYQTAEAISTQLGLPIKIHPLVHEMEKPTVLDNVADESEINLKFLEERKANRGNFDWKFNNGGESFNETIDRAKKVLQFLEAEHPIDTVAIVTHGTFSMVLISLILLGIDSDKTSFEKVFMSLRIHNTGVSSFKYNPETKHWTMICFNDQGHLEKIES
ncbi:MAG TPA: hypothetical protein DEV73_01860 [Candidatus Zambryskibacteria bacterium]|uniref:Phosphoglycerate mutase n=1 Tax=Candidatus Collierbacteria bacterium GW2011_GWC2_43_12 TaxID=1618390 RepID=A0A0G1D3W0_9BACT|nr:MAG: hypothetical protein UV68_C0046G0013 [Candidatus Collierbacteria bacterium GW2011_GWC2_43_12]HCH59343.1 hypothetical protein [Candidatus Zambryskibacteria bacterium]